METKSLEMRGSFSDTAFTVVDTDAIHDLALLKPEQNLAGPGHAAVFLVSRPKDGERVAVSGYPLGKSVLITTSGNVASSWGFEYFRQPTPVPGITLPKTKDVFLVDMHVNHGNSGGPVYSVETGRVIGVCDAFGLEDNVMLEAAMPAGQPDPAFLDHRALMTQCWVGGRGPSALCGGFAQEK